MDVILAVVMKIPSHLDKLWVTENVYYTREPLNF